MNPTVKIILYVALAACLGWFGRAAFKLERNVDGQAGSATNAPVVTNAAATNAVAADLTATNAATTNPAAATTDEAPQHRPSERLGRMMTYGFLAFGALVGLGLLIARDVSHFLANRVEKFVFNDDLTGVRNPEYELAEETWQKGHYLEAIQLMRDFLKKNPSEQYAALRIAEIYETDLGNYLAAALEYEEVLKKKLPAERWGWAAIHLANLYSGKLNKPRPAEALLRRIIDEYGQTAAAKKARERLGIPEPVEAQPEAEAPPEEPKSKKDQAEDAGPKLPPGFRPLK